MHIYIDEAGGFVVPLNRGYSISLVLALVIPSARETNLFAAFNNVLNRWTGGKNIEVKGSSLDEAHAAKIIDLLSRYDVVVEFYAVDMVSHTNQVIDNFKTRQAAAITADLTKEHHPNIAQQLHNLAQTTRNTPNQLFIQAFLTMELVLETIQNATLYYVQRKPEELGDIEWVVDRKDRTITEMERLWSTLILPAAESHFAKNAFIALKGFDYSYFDARYAIAPDDVEAIRHLEWSREVYGIKGHGPVEGAIDINRLLTKPLKFLDSRDSPGLQLADMAASILRRAFNDQLKSAGWSSFGRLLVRSRRGHSRFLALGRVKAGYLTGHLASVWRQLNRHSKPMFP